MPSRVASAEIFTPPFEGFRPDAFAFLRELAANQDRAWFNANKARYETELLAPLTALVSELTETLRMKGLPFEGSPARAIFRIHRDVRFSNDKSPYKTHAGAALTRNGEKMSPGMLYVHIDPKGSFAASGFYRPEPAALAAIRARIASKPAAYRAMLEKLEAVSLALSPDEDALKRPPAGFAQVDDPEIAEALRRRSFVVRQALTPSETRSSKLLATLAGFAVAAKPLLDFGWNAIDPERSALRSGRS